jgi:hypothetical protein
VEDYLSRPFRPSLVRAAALVLCGLTLSAEMPPLTLETAEHATAYMEWMLDARFTAEQRQRYQQVLAAMWRMEGTNQAIVTMARVHEQLTGMNEGERERMRAATQEDFLRLLESANDGDSRWLLDIYRVARSGRPVDSTVTAPRPANVAPPALLGRWTDGHISSIQYQNAYTGVSAPTNGRSFACDFKSDGTYSFTGLMQSVVYNCTTAMFSNETGTYSVMGDSIALSPGKNQYRMTNSCAPSSNREAPGKLVHRTYRFRIVAETGRKYLELHGDDGSVQKLGQSR